ncbi:group 1 glycosyl transferase [Hylemonella gracilis ATCC 19624]|uniref:Group 1 glycosyl transferase n=2 Tax=Hylemonella gracilis TaxID=80880 RepID=F3KSC7_9BURK|nr:group 1 glycosyl transferase [Hylemonella gracilis ATCC 19624]
MSPALVFKARQLHREKPFDAFHLHFQDPLSHLASLLLPRKVPRVITWHHDIVRQKAMLSAYRPWLQNELRRADALVAATQAHFDTSAQIPVDIPAERKHVIPYGLDFGNLALNHSTVLLVDALRVRADGRKLIFALGRHVSYKGFDVLIAAMRQVDALLLLGGSGPLSDALKAQAHALDVADRVAFVGRIPEADLAAYFHACDVFCLPSVTQVEAFGLVQLEAMACGKPVICTLLNNGVNVVNVNGETGMAVPPQDAGALAIALNLLLQNDAVRQQMGRQAQARALGLYSLSAMTQRHLQLYQDLPHASR